MLNSGCNDLSKINADDVVYEVKSSNPQDMEAFLHRLNRYPSSLFSDVIYDEQKSELVFRRGMPDTKTVQYMSKTLGVFAIYAEENPTSFISNQHIDMADVSIRDNNTFIQFKLTNYGQELLHNITQPYLGRTVVVKLDEVILLKATVQEELGKYFELTFDGSTERAKEISVLIESGSLIEPISLNQKIR